MEMHISLGVLSCFCPVRLFATSWTVTLPGSSVCGILQARIVEWVAVPSSRGSSQPRVWTHISGGFLTTSAPWEAHITLSKDIFCLQKIPRSRTSGSYDSPIFNILRNLHIVFCSGCTTLHSHQHCTRVPFSSHASQRLLSVVFLTRAFLKDSFLTIPAEKNGNAFQYSCQENSMDRRTWWAIVYGFAECNNWATNTQTQTDTHTDTHTHTHTHTHTLTDKRWYFIVVASWWLIMLSTFSCTYWLPVFLLWKIVHIKKKKKKKNFISFAVELNGFFIHIYLDIDPLSHVWFALFSPIQQVGFSFYWWFPLLCSCFSFWCSPTCLFLLLCPFLLV